MTEEAADKFAKTLIEQFGKQQEFQFEMPEGHNADLVVEALERRGCKVDKDRTTGALKVEVATSRALS